MSAICFTVPSDPAWRELIRDFGSGRIDCTDTTAERSLLWDTPDWRLINRGQYLVQSQGPAELRSLLDGSIIASGTPPRGKRPFFPAELESSDLRRHLEEAADIRAIVPHMHFSIQSTRYNVLNEDGKTVLRLTYEREKSPDTALRLILHPLKGYSAEARRFRQHLEATGLKPSAEPSHRILRILRQAGVDPATRGRGPALDPDAPAIDSCRRILSDNLKLIRENLPGTQSDVDTEFLHDLRVALRRTRSLLQLIPNVFTDEAIGRHCDTLKSLANATNAVRDLDVYILQRGTYRAMIPASLRRGLDRVFDELAAARKTHFKEMKRYLKSANTQLALDNWQAFLEEKTPAVSGAMAHVQTLALARMLLAKRFRKILRMGSAITPESPDKKLHNLRLEVKKMRYLLEFFGSLFEGPEIRRFLKGFRSLQTVLGDFNDYAVQEAMIRRELEAAEASQRPSAIRCAALGALVSGLERKRRRTRSRFNRAFEKLRAKGNRRSAKILFAQ